MSATLAAPAIALGAAAFVRRMFRRFSEVAKSSWVAVNQMMSSARAPSTPT